MKQQEVFLALASLLPLVVILVKCICCWQKSKIIKEENTVYEEHLPEGRRFTVVRSKTVTRPNQMTRETPPSPAQAASSSELRNGGVDEQPNYENIVIGKSLLFFSFLSCFFFVLMTIMKMCLPATPCIEKAVWNQWNRRIMRTQNILVPWQKKKKCMKLLPTVKNQITSTRVQSLEKPRLSQPILQEHLDRSPVTENERELH
ncbi:hypothetical protein HHUSO_G26847 [Huso huso]|uniref:Uncharacterized protein n=1 Tax=Huso huso TaxID=61971 RepID=A0ABR0YLG4_HUSHU